MSDFHSDTPTPRRRRSDRDRQADSGSFKPFSAPEAKPGQPVNDANAQTREVRTPPAPRQEAFIPPLPQQEGDAQPLGRSAPAYVPPVKTSNPENGRIAQEGDPSFPAPYRNPYYQPGQNLVFRDGYENGQTPPPLYQNDPQEDEEDEESPRRGLLVARLSGLILILVLGFYFLVPPKSDNIFGKISLSMHDGMDGIQKLLGLQKEQAPKLIKFETPLSEVQIGVKTVFSFSSDSAIDGVRMIDDEGNEVKGSMICLDAPNNTLWTISVIFDEPYVGSLTAGMLKKDLWYISDKIIIFSATEPVLSPAPSEDPGLLPEASATPAPGAAVITGSENPFSATATAAPFADAQATDMKPLVLVTPEPLPLFTPAAAAMQDENPEEENAGAENPEDENTEEEPNAEEVAETPDASPLPVQAEASPDAGKPAESADQPAMTESTETPQLPSDEGTGPLATAQPAFRAEADESAKASKMGIVDGVYKAAQKQNKLTRKTPLNLQGGSAYTRYDNGVFAFRGDAFRQNAALGTVDINLKQLSVLWKTDLGGLAVSGGQTLYGVGWTGQPAIIKWPKEIREMMNLNDEKKGVNALKEVIFSAQDGKVYFLDLNDGKETRKPINVGFPLKGSVSVDPQSRPLLSFGQGVSKLSNKVGNIGYYLYNLVDQKKALFINGRKSNKQSQYSTNGAFDGSALFDMDSDTMIIAGENGLLYTTSLNVQLDYQDKKNLSLKAETYYLKSKGKEKDANVAVEGSVAAAGSYGFFADKQGLLRCVDLNTLSSVWAFDCGDNTDATPALDYDADGSLGLYIGNTAFTRIKSKTPVTLRKIDAASGKEVWKYEVPCSFDNTEYTGAKASPLIGQNAIKDLVIFTLNKTENGGMIIALNKQSGEKVWAQDLANGALSSPVAVYTKDGTAYVIQADLKGRLHLIDGLTGEIVNTLDLDGRIEASPAVYKDVLVIGTCSKDNHKMYGIRIE